MRNVYVKMTIGHKSFNTGKIAIVSVPGYSEYLTTYEMLAKEKICEKLGLDKEEVHVLSYSVLGSDVLFID